MPSQAATQPDLREKGAQGQTSDRRLFMQLLAFGQCDDSGAAAQALAAESIAGTVYEDLNDPYGIAIVTFADNPDHFVTDVRRLLQRGPFTSMRPKPEYTMFGRTYTIGYEPDVQEALFDRPRQTLLNGDWPWAVWYPLRRSGAFAQLDHQQQRDILKEHGELGIAFGRADYAHDIRLACYGLDKNDNDFVIGLFGAELFPLSAVVQAMRKTTQTSQYIASLGPFFIGKAVWQSESD